ncbi:Dit2 protein [Lindgomyces ingoldianus]|uniref:Dit2 protein n=1 Tax=Lindgomyces ingoldianus TaxID=673940 RepID=A0ACB6R976_9PLEO|nr:Dit2 protein [Lindgomyces ingoldianus]KAF2475879.1 Dit2 protein [Lindgomyces ingoldianus]
MFYLVVAVVFLLFIITWGSYRVVAGYVVPPAHFPKNVPTIPFYYTLLPLLKEVDQEGLWHKYLKKPLTEHGAVKIYFGGAWNVLITRPTYIAQVFKQDDVFLKAGNHVKNPHSVLALYTGENIISSIGENWKRFSYIVKPGLQADVDTTIIVKNAEKLIKLLLDEQARKGAVIMSSPLQQYTLANLSEALLGSSFNTIGNPEAPMTKLQTEIKPHIFNPFYLNFPMLDHFKIASREEARRLVRKFKAELANIVLSGHHHKHPEGMDSSHLGCRLVTAYETGILNRYHFEQNCVSTFLAGHENPQILLLSMMRMLAEHQDLQVQLRQKILDLSPEDQLSASALANLPLLTSVIYETLRLYPPISQLLNRRTTEDVLLGDNILLQAGTYVGYNGYTTNRDKEFWGPDAEEFRPSRWGETIEDINSLFRRASSKSTFISFHGGKRTCLGIKFAMTGARLSMSMFLRNLEWQLDPTWPKKMTPAGPLMPKMLRLQFKKLEAMES